MMNTFTIPESEGPADRVVRYSASFGTVALHCPVCGYDYNHRQREYVRNGDVVIEYRCEADEHLFRVVFEDHKGNVLAYYEVPEQERRS